MPGWALAGRSGGFPIPPPIPTSGLLLDLASENYSINDDGGGNATGTWLDQSGNANNLATDSLPVALVPEIQPAEFNTDPGVNFVRAIPTDPVKKFTAPVWYSANAPRTVAMVFRGSSSDPGAILLAIASHIYGLIGSTLPQIVYSGNAQIKNTGTFVDTNGQKVVVMWWTTGAIGAPLFVTVNADQVAPLDATMPSENAIEGLMVGFGTGIGRSNASVARIVAYNRVLDETERAAVNGNFTARYL